MTHKKMFQFLTLSLFVALVLFAPLAAQNDSQKKACCEKKMKAEGCEKMKAEGCMMLKAIPNLSEEQKGKLEKMHAEHQAMMAAAMAEMQKKCQAHQLAVRALLTDEQKTKFAEMGCGGMMHGMGCMMDGCRKDAREGKCCMKGHGMKMEKGKCPKAKQEEKK
jgi:hypothetical protein